MCQESAPRQAATPKKKPGRRTISAGFRIRRLRQSVLVAGLCLSLVACGSKTSATVEDLAASAGTSENRQTQIPAPDPGKKGARDNTPVVMIPLQEGTQENGTLLGNDEVELDLSHAEDGYFSVRYFGPSEKVKLRVTGPNSVIYTYDLHPGSESFEVFPLSVGDGTYKLDIYTNIKETMYAVSYSCELDLHLADQLTPFLYPNQYVWFDENTKAIPVAEETVRAADDDLEAISYIYRYVITHVSYDFEEAKTVQSDYLPDVDEVLSTGLGICLDYSALMTCMLRSQNIPARLEIGYAGTAYHAWISTYVEEIGWIGGIIEFDGKDWSLIDPTFASTDGSETFEDFVGDGTNYQTCYVY